ncbi:MAG: hybrid sensor histidine kinase/response regulator, partial [Candidatus Muiribacteriaceae bacterium]
SIIGFSDLLESTDLDDDQDKFLQVIKRSSDHLLVLINDIIDLAKIESDQFEINVSEVSITDMLKDLRMFFSQQIKSKKDLSFNLSFPEDDIIMVSDPIRLKQVMMNLVSNALKFTSSGTVDIWVEKKNGSLFFYVKDTGIGIPSDKKEVIFEKFTQVDASFTRKYGGVGLGLTISKKIINVLDGDIGFESEPGEGSLFYFRIPIKDHKSEKKSDSRENTEESDTGNKEKILIVEDTMENIMLLRTFLTRANYDIIYATNGREALEVYNNTDNISLILMDVQMPVMTGDQAVKNIRKIEKDTGRSKIPILALTAHAMSGDEERFMDAGFDGYIPKPFKLKEILDIISDHL